MFCNTLSNSKRETFLQCGWKYKLKYVDKYVEPDKGNTDALHFGSYIHEILELGVKASTYEELELLATELRPKYSFPDVYKPKIAKCIKNFLHFNATLSEIGITEHHFTETIVGDITVNGYIDRIIKGLDGGMLIIDYKTSKREKSKLDLFTDAQGKIYTYAAHKGFDIPIKKITFAHYYPLTDNLVTVSYTPQTIAKHNKMIVEDVWKIRKKKATDFYASVNQFCNWCGYKSVCPEFFGNALVQERLNECKKQPPRK